MLRLRWLVWHVIYHELFRDCLQILILILMRLCALNIRSGILRRSLCEKCQYTEFFLANIFPYSDWIRRFTPKSLWSIRIQEYTDQEKRPIWKPFAQWIPYLFLDFWIKECLFTPWRIFNLKCFNIFNPVSLIFEMQMDVRQSCYHIEISQLICSANQLTGFYMIATLAFNEL